MRCASCNASCDFMVSLSSCIRYNTDKASGAVVKRVGQPMALRQTSSHLPEFALGWRYQLMRSERSEGLSESRPLEFGWQPSLLARPPLLVFHVNDSTDDQVLFQTA